MALISAPIQGTVVAVAVAPGDLVREGQEVVVLESMKMEHGVVAELDGRVLAVSIAVGDQVAAGQHLVEVEAAVDRVAEAAGDRSAGAGTAAGNAVAPAEREAGLRADRAEVAERHRRTLDAARPDAVAKRHDRGHRTARENIADLVDDGSFAEYGALVIAAQRRRRSFEDLVDSTPADGLVGGVGTVGGRSVVAMSYDYTVLAGTQGLQNHRKKDRLFELAERQQLPVVFFTEGGGGRPGDTDGVGPTGLDCLAFALFAKLSGQVALVGVCTGFCFAGNAAILGCCDVIIATQDAHIGMGGPAMIEGGGLGVFAPTRSGPMSVQTRNGVVDVLVPDDRAAVAAAKQVLSYLDGPSATWEAADQAELRDVVPENRRRAYDVRRAIELLCDTGSVLELRKDFGIGMVTAFARIEGRPVGIVANNPQHLAGAIDADAADKAARHLQLCESYGLPVLFLCDTPGIMVGPESEAEANVRHASRLFVAGAGLTVPFAASCCARATASARRRWPAAASRRRCSRSPGRPGSSAGWGSRGPCGSAIAESSRRSRTRPSASRPSSRWSRPPTSTARRSTRPRTSRSTT